MKLEELMVKVLAKRKGIPEEQAQAFLDAIRGTDEYEELKASLARLVDTGQIVQQMPPHIQSLAIPLMMQAMQSRPSPQKIAENVAMTVAAIKAAYGDDSSKLIEDLRREIQALKEEKEKKEMQEMLSQTMGAFEKYVQRLEERIAQLEAGNGRKVEEEEGDEIDKLERYLQKVEQTKEKLKRLGLVKEGKEDVDLDKAIETLRRLGYKIEAPPSWEQLKRMMEEEWKKREEEIRKQIEQEMGIQEKKMTMALELATAIIDGIVSAATTPQGQSEVAKFTQAVKGLFGGMSGGGGGEANAGGAGAVEADIEAGEHSEQVG